MRSAALLIAGAVTLVPVLGPAAADHPGALRQEPLTPLATAALSGALALVAGLLLVVLVMYLTRGDRAARDRTDPE